MSPNTRPPCSRYKHEQAARPLAAAHRFLKGRIRGVPGSWVRLNRIGDRWTGGFFDGRELYLVDRAGAFELPANLALWPDQTIVFRFGDIDWPHPVDAGGLAAPGATDAVSGNYSEFIGHLREIADLQATAMLSMPVTVVSDARFSARHGADAAAVVAGRINFIDGLFASQLGTGLVLWHHEALADDGPLTSTDPSTLLSDQFGPFMRAGPGSDIPFAGLAHLFTGRDMDGGTVGIAYLGVLCNTSFGIGVSQDLSGETMSSLVIAHELGHNFGAAHDDNTDACPSGTLAGIMNSRINGSQEFSQCSLDAMSDDVASADCLVDTGAAQTIFSDDFES